MATQAPLYAIRDWNKYFEVNRTRELKRLSWVPIPNTHDGDGYTQLLEHPKGAEHYAAWVTIVQIASRCEPRGTLVRDGPNGPIPHDPTSLARMTRIPAAIFARAIPRLLEVGWLQALTSIPQEGAGIPQEAASTPPTPPAGGCLEGKGREGKERREDSPADKPRPRQPDPIWDTLCQAFGLNPQTKAECSRIGKIVSDLKLKAATPEEIGIRRVRYQREWPTVACTPEALLKHWDRFAKEPDGHSSHPSGKISRVSAPPEKYDRFK